MLETLLKLLKNNALPRQGQEKMSNIPKILETARTNRITKKTIFNQQEITLWKE